MKTLRRILPLALLSIVTVASLALSAGTTAPDFTLPDTAGKTHSLADYKGKYVVLEWFSPDCPFVKKNYDSGNMQSLQRSYTDKGVVWLSIDSSASGKPGNYPPAELASWEKTEAAAATAVLLDTDGKVGREYTAKTTPDMYVIDPKGMLVYEGAIDSIPSDDKDDIAKATNYVKAALDEAMAGKPVTTPNSRPYGCGIKY
jgi:peroxiredoxin